MTDRRWKVLFDGDVNWSLGYPTRAAAEAAARRLRQIAPVSGARYTVAPMEPLDYDTLAQLEELER